MPFYPGSATDLLSRRAIIAADTGQRDGTLPQLLGKDTFFGAAGERWPVDAPNPSFAALLRQNVVARTAADLGQFDTPLPSFVGTDTFFAGRGAGPDYDYPNPSFSVIGTRAFVARLSADAGQWNAPLPLLAGTAVALPVGAQSQDVPLRAVGRARDYSQTSSFPLELIGQDARNTGAQAFDLPPKAAPRATTLHDFPSTSAALLLSVELPIGQGNVDAQYRTAPRARDYSIAASFPLGLIGQDAFTPGEQLSGNAPAGPRRATEYTFLTSFPLFLIGQDQMATGRQSQDLPAKAAARTFALYDPGINAALSLAQPSGQSAQDQQYRLAPRVRDYTFTAATFLGLLGQDAFAAGAQISGNAPAGARRAASLSETGSNQLLLLTSAPPVFPYGQSTFASDGPPRAALRAREYGQTSAFPLTLIGQDATGGSQQFNLPPRGAPRSISLSETGSNQTILLTAAPPVFPYGLASLDSQYRTPPRSREYGQASNFPLELIGKDQFNAGASTASSELPPRAAARARDYTFAASFPLTLNGRDTFFGAPGESQAFDWTPPVRTIPRSFALYDPGTNLTILLPVATVALPVGKQAFDLPVRVIARASTLGEPGVNQTNLPPSVVLPVGAQATDLLPAKAPARLKDYGQTFAFPLELIGKDQLPNGDSTASSELPPKGPLRALDYTWLQSLPLHVYQQLPPGDSTASSELTPKTAPRLPDYTFLSALKAQFIGKDTLFGAPGEVQAFDWQLPPRGPQRSIADTYSIAENFSLGNAVPPRDLFYIASSPLPKWTAREIENAKWRTFGLPPGKWAAKPPSQ